MPAQPGRLLPGVVNAGDGCGAAGFACGFCVTKSRNRPAKAGRKTHIQKNSQIVHGEKYRSTASYRQAHPPCPPAPWKPTSTKQTKRLKCKEVDLTTQTAPSVRSLRFWVFWAGRLGGLSRAGLARPLLSSDALLGDRAGAPPPAPLLRMPWVPADHPRLCGRGGGRRAAGAGERWSASLQLSARG
jgi:hypothetical protein